MIRVLTILAAIGAFAVSAAPVASAHNQPFDDGAGNISASPSKPPPPGLLPTNPGVPESISFLNAARSKPPRAIVTRSGGEILSDFAKSKPNPAGVYDHGLTQVRPELMEDALTAARKPPPRGTTGVVTNNNDPDKLGKFTPVALV